MDIRNEALNLLIVLSYSVGSEYEDQDLALEIVEDTMQKIVKESDSLPCGSESKSFDIHNCINEVCDAVHARFHLYGQTAKGDGSFRWRVKQAIDKMLYSR